MGRGGWPLPFLEHCGATSFLETPGWCKSAGPRGHCAAELRVRSHFGSAAGKIRFSSQIRIVFGTGQ
jgi:hypothetical protein